MSSVRPKTSTSTRCSPRKLRFVGVVIPSHPLQQLPPTSPSRRSSAIRSRTCNPLSARRPSGNGGGSYKQPPHPARQLRRTSIRRSAQSGAKLIKQTASAKKRISSSPKARTTHGLATPIPSSPPKQAGIDAQHLLSSDDEITLKPRPSTASLHLVSQSFQLPSPSSSNRGHGCNQRPFDSARSSLRRPQHSKDQAPAPSSTSDRSRVLSRAVRDNMPRTAPSKSTHTSATRQGRQRSVSPSPQSKRTDSSPCLGEDKTLEELADFLAGDNHAAVKTLNAPEAALENDTLLKEIEASLPSWSSSAARPFNEFYQDYISGEDVSEVDTKCLEAIRSSIPNSSSEEEHEAEVNEGVENSETDGVEEQIRNFLTQNPSRMAFGSPKQGSTNKKAVPEMSLIESTRSSPTSSHAPGETASAVPVLVSLSWAERVAAPCLDELLKHLSGSNPLRPRIPLALIDRHIKSSPSKVKRPNQEEVVKILDETDCLVGLEDLESEVRSTLNRTVAEHEGNALLLCGARGSGKTSIISRSLSLMSHPNLYGPRGFIVIKLNGLIQHNNRLALKEMARQLLQALTASPLQHRNRASRELNHIITSTSEEEEEDSPDAEEERAEEEGLTANCGRHFINYAETLKNLLRVLEPVQGGEEVTMEAGRVTKSKAMVIVLEEFDRFASFDRQSFLYCLLDVVQGDKRRGGICVIGTTCVVDCLDRLEKRVKSRFQSRIRYMTPVRSREDRVDLLRSVLKLDEGVPTIVSAGSGGGRLEEDKKGETEECKVFIERWNEGVEKFVKSKDAVRYLERKFDLMTEAVPSVLRDLNLVISRLAYQVRNSKVEKPSSELANPEGICKYLTSGLTGSSPSGLCHGQNTSTTTTRSGRVLPWWTHQVSMVELSILIACKHLSQVQDHGIFNLEMAWNIYRAHLKRISLSSQSDHHPQPGQPYQQLQDVTKTSHQVYGRHSFELGWERLKRLELILAVKTLNQSTVYLEKQTQTMTSIRRRAKTTAGGGSSSLKGFSSGGFLGGGSGGGGGGGVFGLEKRFEWVKLVPFLSEVDEVVLKERKDVGRHLCRWAKNCFD